MPARLLRWGIGVALVVWVGVSVGQPRFWLFAAILMAIASYVSAAADPTLFEERRRPGGPTIDAGALRAIRLCAMIELVIALCDIGLFHWSDTVPPSARAPAMAIFATSSALAARAIVANRFFSIAVRLQADRGHHVVREGPYGIIRHPGYLGMMVAAPAAALALGSWWALLPALVYSALIARRAAIEDRYLREHLDGYADYARSVRFRLMPGIW